MVGLDSRASEGQYMLEWSGETVWSAAGSLTDGLIGPCCCDDGDRLVCGGLSTLPTF